MINCNQIKRLIDQAEQPELLPFEATHHLNACAPCRRFADERAALRALLNGMPRVNAPINFDVQLKARMTGAKARPAAAWFNPTVYMRFGAASAVLLVAVFVAQYNGLFTLTDNQASIDNASAAATTNHLVPPSTLAPKAGEKLETPPAATRAAMVPHMPLTAVSTSKGRVRRVQPVAVTVDDAAMAGRVPGVILRRSGADVELPMLPVSVGAQQKLINRSGRSTVQPIAISF